MLAHYTPGPRFNPNSVKNNNSDSAFAPWEQNSHIEAFCENFLSNFELFILILDEVAHIIFLI